MDGEQHMFQPAMKKWKRILLTSAGLGAGLALGIALIAAGLFWYQSRPRPRPPKPWSTSAISATFDFVDTEGEKNTIVFFYLLQNNTAFDFKLTDRTNVIITAKLGQQKSLSLAGADKFFTIDYPIFIPSRQRVRFAIHVDYAYIDKLKSDASPEERKKHHEAVAAFANKEMGNLDGFALFDETNRYEINFPKGW